MALISYKLATSIGTLATVETIVPVLRRWQGNYGQGLPGSNAKYVPNVISMVIMLVVAASQQSRGRQGRPGKGIQANFVEGQFENSGENDAFAFTIEEQTCALSSSAEPVISVSIGGVS